MEPLSVGVIGCGTISDAYFEGDAVHDAFDVVACADIDEDAREAKAAEYGLDAYATEELLETDVEAVVNLTPPTVHADVCVSALEAGKHVYTEKPLAATTEGADRIREAAAESDRLLGSAPDTFLGAGIQTARKALDDGAIGEPVGATAAWTSPGHEVWHPQPDLYYQAGGGPLFDMGPYYLSALVFLLGPANRVSGSVTRASETRTIGSGPRAGEEIDVEVPTHEAGTADFGDGVVADLLFSFDAPASTLPSPAFEVYGTEGTLALPDPNHFSGPVRVKEAGDEEWTEIECEGYTAGRGAGVADLAFAARGEWEHRTNGAFAGHVLDILEGVRESSERGEHLSLEGDFERPAVLPDAFPESPF